MSTPDKPLKSFNVSHALKEIRRQADTLEQELRKLDVALEEQNGVVRPLFPCPLAATVRGKTIGSYLSPEAAKKAATEALEPGHEVEKQNAAIASENLAIIARLSAQIVNAGIPGKQREVKGRGYRQTVRYVPADWQMSLSHGVAVSTEWATTKASYNDWIRRCDELIRERDTKREAEKRAEEARLKKLEADLQIARIAERHGLPISTPAREVLNHLLRQNKYLRLAHGMQLTRGDWSDGPWATRDALDSFTVETQLDSEIAANIQCHLLDWDDDGRIFRDCAYNYGVLFGMVTDEQLMADYNVVAQAVCE